MSDTIINAADTSELLLQQEIEKRNQIEAELNRHRQYIDAQSAKLQLLNELATGLSQVITDEETYKLVALKATGLLEVERASVALLNETKDVLEVFALDGTKGAIPTGAQLPVEGTQLGEVVKTHQVVIVHDTAESSWLDAMKLGESGMGSLMDAPLIVSGSIIGTLNVGTVQKNIFTQRDSELLLQAATLLATTLEKNRLLAQTKDDLVSTEAQAQRLDLLNDFALELGHVTSQNEAFGVAAKYLSTIYGADRSSLALLSEHGDHIEIFGLEGMSTSLEVGTKIPTDNTGIGTAIANKQLLYLPDASESTYLDTKKLAEDVSLRSMMITPLILSDKAIGTLNVAVKEVDAYPAELRQLMRQTAALLATTLENIQLLEQTQQSEEQFRTVIANLPIPIAITNLTTGQLPYVNYAFTELFGGSLETIANKKMAVDYYADPIDRAQILEAFRQDGQLSHAEVKFKTEDGSYVWADIAMQHINYFGMSAVLTGFNDVTNRKQTEEMLKQAKESAEEANYLKSKFLSNMSHELRTPLNAIINMTGFVMDGMLGEVNEEQVDALEKTVDGGNHLLSLINDVLDLTKIEAGLMNVVFEPVDIKAILQGICSTGKGLVKEANIQLISNLNEDLPQIIGDRRRIRQIFLNLISNAVKYTEKGSVTVDAHVEDQGIAVTVTDTGIGIAPEDFDLIFEEFKQAKTNTGNVASTGLGLPITKQLVEMHDGQIWFESEQGKGSSFHVFLPLVPSNTSNALMFEQNGKSAIKM